MGSLIEARRRILMQPKIVAASFTLTSTNNTYTTTTPAMYSPGAAIEITVKKTNDPSNITKYSNGYFNFLTPELKFGRQYIFTADADVVDNKLSSSLIGIASVGVGSTERRGSIENGRMKIAFTFIKKSGSNDKYLEFHCGGKSMMMRNIRILEL